MSYLAIDAATLTGYAEYVPIFGFVQSGTVDFTGPKGEPEDLKLLRFRNWVRQMLDADHRELVLYEEPHEGGTSGRFLMGLANIIRLECADRHVSCVGVRSTSIKKLAGSGNATKEEMTLWASQRFYWLEEKFREFARQHGLRSHQALDALAGEPKIVKAFNNECDALWGLSYALVAYAMESLRPSWCAGLTVTPPKQKTRKKKGKE